MEPRGKSGIELKGKTVGIFGYGYMGSAFAEKLKGFECRVIAYDKYKTEFGNPDVEEVDLDRLFTETEILSIHVPLTSETKNMFDLDFLKKFRKLKILLNTARGGVLSNETVIHLLENQMIIGAGLDVLENEKLDKMTEKEAEHFEFLINSERVLLTPHVGGWSHESYRRINEVLIAKLEKQRLI